MTFSRRQAASHTGAVLSSTSCSCRSATKVNPHRSKNLADCKVGRCSCGGKNRQPGGPTSIGGSLDCIQQWVILWVECNGEGTVHNVPMNMRPKICIHVATHADHYPVSRMEAHGPFLRGAGSLQRLSVVCMVGSCIAHEKEHNNSK